MNHSRPILSIGTTILWRVLILNASRTDSPVDSVTSVTSGIYDSGGILVQDSDITLVRDVGDEDIYWGEFPNTLSLIPGSDYEVRTIVATVIDGFTKITSVRTPMRAHYETGQ